MYARVDIKSNDRKRPPYALQGDVLKVVIDNPDVCICEDKKGERFPVHVSNLSEEYVPVIRELTKVEQKLKERLTKVLKLSKDGKSFIELSNKVKSGEIDKFDIAENREQWLDIARMVWTERFGTKK